MRYQATIFRVWAGLALALGLLVGGCGPGQSDPCADKTCKLGTCDTEDGSCVNPSECTTEADCLAGYTCNADQVCEPLDTCEADPDCATGSCEDGVCVNPDSCSKDADCLPKSFCDPTAGSADAAGKGACRPDPCVGIRCPRGVCERGTDRCVSKESCSTETEQRDCVSGQSCADGTCVDNDSFCEQLTCDRGVCSLEESGCVNADECEGDEECLDGYFCNEMDLCQRDLCDRDDVDCKGNGVCKPKSGRCENSTDCSSNDDCLSDHYCVEGTCRQKETACGNASGDGGCPGNQTCEHDSENLTVSCEEPKYCTTSLDCKNDGRCNGRTCLSPESCSEDRFEMNDQKSDATAFVDNSRDRTLWASSCKGNDDFYDIDTTNLIGPASRGTMIVQVDVPPRDRGLGKLEVELTDEGGTTHGTATTGASGADGRARITKRILVHEHGTYTVRVSPGSNVKKPGVGYRLSVDILPKETVEACENAASLGINQRVTGTTKEAKSKELGSTCTRPRNSSNEKIYRMDLDRPQELTLELTPKESQKNLSMSLRRHCEQPASEVACASSSGAGAKETLTRIVRPGTYYVIVQAPEREVGGPFELIARRTFTTCAPSGSYCDAMGDLHECTLDGAGYRKTTCDSGCNRSRGRCIPPDGDICGTAQTIDPMNAQTRTLNLDQANDTYSAGPRGCVSTQNAGTEGPDLSYEVKIPKKKSVRFETKYKNNVEGSMYLVGDCGKVDDTCEKGVRDSTNDDDREVLQYSNTTDQAETLYLIVDTAGGQKVTTAELDVTYKDVICSPGKRACKSGDAKTCNRYGTAFKTTQNCGTLGCTGGKCVGETCSSPVSVQVQGNYGTTQSWSWTTSDYDDDYDIGFRSCTPSDSDGGDAVFQVDVQQGDVVEATWSHSQGQLYVVPKGGCTNVSSNCITGSGGSTSTIRFQAGSSQKYNIIADHDSFSGRQGNLDITVTKPQCKPPTYTSTCSGNQLKTCDTGKIITKSCPLSCSGGKCRGDTCSGAHDATTAANQSGGVSYTADWGKFTDDYNYSPCSTGTGSSIGSFDTGGREVVFKVDLQSGETVNFSISTRGDPSLWIKSPSDCGSSNRTCLAADENETGSTSISYSASSTETVHLIADREGSSGSDSFTVDIDIQ